MTDLFFLVLSKEDRTHLRVMARLARLMLQRRLRLFAASGRGADRGAS